MRAIKIWSVLLAIFYIPSRLGNIDPSTRKPYDYGTPHIDLSAVIFGCDLACNLGVALIILISGICFLRGRKIRTIMLTAAFIRALLGLWGFSSLTYVEIYYGTYYNITDLSRLTFYSGIQVSGLALAISVIFLLLSRNVVQWESGDKTSLGDETSTSRTDSSHTPVKVAATAILGILAGILGILQIIISAPPTKTLIEMLDRYLPHHIRTPLGEIMFNDEHIVITARLYGTSFGENICALGIAVAMLICSIRFFKNKKRTALLIAGATQTLFVLLKIGFILLLYSYLNEKIDYYEYRDTASSIKNTVSINTFLIIMPLLALLILSILLIVFLRIPRYETLEKQRKERKIHE